MYLLIDNSMIKKRGISFLFLIVVLGVFSLNSAFAAGVSLSEVNSTYTQVSISSASNLYAYEVSFDYSGGGSMGGVDFSSFLGSDTVTGTSDDGSSIYSVYESRLDNTQTGITGNGELFNVTDSTSFALRYALFVAADGTEETVYYNASADSGSGSGGGGGIAAEEIEEIPLLLPEEVDITIVPGDLIVSLIVGEEETREISIKNNLGQSITLDVRVEGEELKELISSPDEIVLGPNEEKTLEVDIVEGGRGLVIGKILFVYSGVTVGEVLIAMNTQSAGFLFDSSIFLLEQYRNIFAGENLRAQINLLQVGPKVKVDVTATYVIKDFLGNIYLQESETFFVLEAKDFVKDFSTEDLPPGKYVVGMIITYPGQFATASTQFEVKESRFGSILGTTGYLIGGTIIAIIIFVVIIIALLRGMRKPSLKPSTKEKEKAVQ